MPRKRKQRPACHLGYRKPEDFEDDPDEWESYKERTFGVMKKCALYTAVGHEVSHLDQPTGTLEICLSPKQARTLFGTQKIPERLGCGAFGCAWVKSKTRVVKITADPDDLLSTEVAQGLTHVVKLHRTYELMHAGTDAKTGQPRDVYAMVTERLREVPWQMREWIEALPQYAARESFNEHYGTYDGSPGDGDSSYEIPDKEALIENVCEYDSSDTPEKCERFAREAVNTMEALGKRGINWTDIHPDNFGMTRQGVWKILDLGVSATGSKAEAPPIYGLGRSRRRRIFGLSRVPRKFRRR